MDYNPVVEDVLVDVCLHKMNEDYEIYLESSGWWKLWGELLSLSRKPWRHYNDQVCVKEKTHGYGLEKTKGATVQIRCHTTKEKLAPSTFSFRSKQGCSSLEQWIKYNVIHLPKVISFPLQEIWKIQNTVLIPGRKDIQ